tara:strand:+ start:366 stop:740 length:375 start_codon:yes stop_codon:yes gene_type:complete
MSTLKVNLIQTTSGGSSSTPQQIEQGRAKAWCHWHTDGTTAIDDSFGVSSVSDNGTGFSYVNFSTSFSNSQYCVVCTGQEDSGGGARFTNPKDPETNRCLIEFRNHSNSARHARGLWAAFFGDT